MSFWDKVINQNKIDSSLIAELSDLSYKSIGGKRQGDRAAKEGIVNIGTIPFNITPAPSKITQEMILEYQKDRDNPPPFTYIDPTTGAEEKLKYFPSTFIFDVADLQPFNPVDDAHFGRPATQQDVLDLKLQVKQLVNEDLPQLLTLLKNTQKTLIQINNRINNGTIDPARLAIAQRTKARLEADIVRLETDIATKQNEIEDAKTLIENAKQNIQENKDLEMSVNKTNRDNLNRYRDTLQAVNRDHLNNLVQEPNESDADYLQRMKNIEAEKYDTNLYSDKAELDQVIKLKNNLKKVIRKDDLIENVVKSFTGEQIFLINKHFAAIKEYLLDNFGFNNTNLTTNDLVDEITNTLNRILNPPTSVEIENEDYTLPSTGEPFPVSILKDDTGADTDFSFGTETNSFVISNKANSNSIYLKIGQKYRKVVFYSISSNKQGSFQAIRERGPPQEETIRYLFGKEYLDLSTFARTKILGGAKTIDDLYDVLETQYLLKPITDIKTIRFAGHKKYGWGLSHPDQEIPPYAKFGNIVIALNKLFYKNLLSLATKTGHKIEGLKNTKVSDTFVEIIMKLYNNEDVSHLVKTLSTNETNLYNSILFVGGLHKKFKNSHKDSISSLKEKFNICEGEILSGNNNPEVLKELKDTLLKLHNLNAISLNEIKKYLKQFK